MNGEANSTKNVQVKNIQFNLWKLFWDEPIFLNINYFDISFRYKYVNILRQVNRVGT